MLEGSVQTGPIFVMSSLTALKAAAIVVIVSGGI